MGLNLNVRILILLVAALFVNSMKVMAFAFPDKHDKDAIPMTVAPLALQTALITDYYVSAAGNDNNSGLSPALAWKTIAKVNSFTFSAGARILFRRGDQWRETIIVKGSGAAGNYITYGAYGTGSKPIVNGSDIIKGWTQYSASVWKANCPVVTVYLGLGYDYVAILDGTMLRQVGSLSEVSAQNTFYIDKTSNPDAVYIYSTANPDTKIAEVSTRMFGFYVNNKSFIKLSGLEFRNAGHSGVYFFGSTNSQVSGNSIIDSCNFYRNRISGIEFYDGYSNNLVQNCTSSYNGNGYYSASYTNFGSNGNIFRNCYSGHNLRYRVGIVTDGHGFGVFNSGDCIVEYCEAEYCFFGINVDPNNRAHNFICRYNYIHDTDPVEAGICIGGNIPTGTVHQAYYNLIVNTGGGTAYPWAIAVGGPSRQGKVYLYNNTIFQDGANGHRNGITAANGSNLTIMNNIVCSYSTNVTFLRIPAGSNFVCDNNSFYAPNVSSNVFTYNNINYHTLASWVTATGKDVHSLYGDPLFINKSSDWKLNASSTVINKGASVGLTNDFTGKPLVGLPDIGAFETQVISNIPVPVYVSSTIENATPARLEMNYNLSLANIVPAVSAFSVKVNSVTRTVNSVAVSGTKVSLTLASPVVNGNVVTVAYTKPSANPLQTAAGGQAVTLTEQTITNKVNPAASPVYVSSSVENATPSVLTLVYNLSLAGVVPATSAFTVMVNSVARTVNSVAVSGTKVSLTLASPVVNGNVVKVSYTKPSANFLQTVSGGIAASIVNQAVMNNRLNVAPATSITSPVNYSSFTALANITINANASDPDGSITLVEFYSGGTLIGSKSSAPYTFTWIGVGAGTYSISVVATDNLNAKTSSSAIAVRVNTTTVSANQPPYITISSPVKGNKYEFPGIIEIFADASDPDGTIRKVELFNGEEKLVELTGAPYSYTWKDVDKGTYSITAIATDDLNATTASSAVEFIVGDDSRYDGNSEIIKLYPNPNDGHFTIDLIIPLLIEKSEIIITDLAGKRIYHEPILEEEVSKQIDLSYIKSGIYILMISSKEILVTKKFIKR